MATTKTRTNLKRVPDFRSEDQERQFWSTHDSTELIDWKSAKRRRFPNLKPSLRTISFAGLDD